MEDAEGMLDDVCVSVSVLRSCNTHLMSDYRGLSSPVFLCTGGCLDCELVVANAGSQHLTQSYFPDSCVSAGGESHLCRAVSVQKACSEFVVQIFIKLIILWAV